MDQVPSHYSSITSENILAFKIMTFPFWVLTICSLSIKCVACFNSFSEPLFGQMEQLHKWETAPWLDETLALFFLHLFHWGLINSTPALRWYHPQEEFHTQRLWISLTTQEFEISIYLPRNMHAALHSAANPTCANAHMCLRAKGVCISFSL